MELLQWAYHFLPFFLIFALGYNSFTVQDVEWQAGKKNMGGTAGKIYGTPLENVESIPEPDSQGIIRRNIQLKPFAKLTTIYHTQGTGEVRFEGQGERDGGSFKNTLEWNTPGNEPDNMSLAANSINGTWIFFAKDTDKRLNIIGSLDFGAYRETLNGKTGKAAADKKGIDYGFAADSPTPPLRYAGEIKSLLVQAPIATAADEITNASFDANWNEVEKATAYLLDVSTKPDFDGYVLESFEVNGLTHTVAGLQADTTYYYRVRTRENIYVSSNSNVMAVTTST